MKNNDENKNGSEILFSRRVQLLVSVIGLLIILANVWIVAQLSPLYKDIALNSQQIKAATEDIHEIQIDFENIPTKEDTLAIRSDILQLQADIKELLKAQARIEGLLLAK